MAANAIDPNAIDLMDDLVVEEDYDPIADASEEAAEGFEGGLTKEDSDRAIEQGEDFQPYIGDPEAEHAPEEKVDDRPAEVRTAELFERMKPRRKELLGILALCLDPIDADEVHAQGDRMQSAHRSVYNGEALCKLLVKCGALEKLETEDRQAEVIVEDGVEYLRPAEKKSVRYVTSPVGKAVLDDDRPADRLMAALEKEPQYKPIFLQILKACAEEGGKTAKQLGDLVDRDPLLQQPRRWAAYFFGILGECDALAWDQVWRTTDLGMQGIEALELEGVEA